MRTIQPLDNVDTVYILCDLCGDQIEVRKVVAHDATREGLNVICDDCATQS